MAHGNIYDLWAISIFIFGNQFCEYDNVMASLVVQIKIEKNGRVQFQSRNVARY